MRRFTRSPRTTVVATPFRELTRRRCSRAGREAERRRARRRFQAMSSSAGAVVRVVAVRGSGAQRRCQWRSEDGVPAPIPNATAVRPSSLDGSPAGRQFVSKPAEITRGRALRGRLNRPSRWSRRWPPSSSTARPLGWRANRAPTRSLRRCAGGTPGGTWPRSMPTRRPARHQRSPYGRAKPVDAVAAQRE